MQSLSKARDVRPDAAEFMEQAIAGKKVIISVTPRQSASSDSSVTTKLNIDVTPSITKLGPTKGVVAMVGETKEYVTTLGALANPKSINLGDAIHIAANEWSDGTFGRTNHLGGTCSVPLPLENATRGTLSDGEGSIDVSVKIS